MAAAAVVYLTGDVMLDGPVRHLDALLPAAPRLSRSAEWHPVMVAIAQLGQRHVLVYVVLVSLVARVAVRRSPRAALRPAVACAATVAAVWCLKHGVGRTAPRTGADLVRTAGTEFPSGHAANAVIAWGVVAETTVYLSRRVARWWTPRLRYLAVAIVSALAGIGMIGAGFHWPSDVLAGWAVGATFYLGLIADDSRPAQRAYDCPRERATHDAARSRPPP